MIQLVKLAQADLPFLTKLLNKPDVAKFLFREDRYRRDWEIGEVLIEARPGTETKAFGIVWGEETEISGCICLENIDPSSRTASIGNVAAIHAYQAIAAVREIVKYGFKTLNLNRLDCRYIDGCRLTPLMLKKIGGGTHEGVLREVVYQDGEYKDVHIWSLLRREWDGS